MERSQDSTLNGTNVRHGFVRDKHGAIIEFDVPGMAGLGPWASIAPNGAVVGLFNDADYVIHGFVREADRGVQQHRYSVSNLALSKSDIWFLSPSRPTKNLVGALLP
jgi:hypothetical protein